MPFLKVLSPCDNVTRATATKRRILQQLHHKTMHNSTNGSYNDHISQLAHDKNDKINFFCDAPNRKLSLSFRHGASGKCKLIQFKLLHCYPFLVS